MKSHGIAKPNFYCYLCDEKYFNEQDLWKHNQDEHDTSRDSKQWNCNNCDFQCTTSTPLRNHCKVMGHQPSKTVQDSRNRLVICNTCEHEFTSFWNLMNHRKQKHPSNRKCRNFVRGECKHGELCWYVHDNVMEIDSQNTQENQPTETKVKCYICDTDFSSKNEMMNHKKTEHPSNIVCKNFLLGLCRRPENQCWYLHQTSRSVSHKVALPNNLNTSQQPRQLSPTATSPATSSVNAPSINLNPSPQSKQSSESVSPPGASTNHLNISPKIFHHKICIINRIWVFISHPSHQHHQSYQ